MRFLTTLFIFLTLLLGTVHSAEAFTLTRGGNQLGLVAWYTFDGKDMTQNVADTSGNGNNGHIIGQTSTSTTQGKLGQALLFDGNDDRVYVPDNNSLDITSAVTISAWVYPTAIGSCCQTIIDKEDLSGAERSNYVFQLDNRQLSFGFYNAGLANWATFYVSCCAESDLLSNNKWYHIVATHTFGSGASTKIYVNGVVTTGTWTLGTGNESVVANSDPIYIGQSGNSGPYENFPGRIDDVRIYNRYLSSSEVAQLYAQGAGTKQSVSLTPKTSGLNSGLVGYWTFDGKDMTGNVKDTSGTGADGNLLNNTVASTTIGKFGQALNLDGVLGCVNIDTNTGVYRDNLNTTGAGTSTTWSAWIYPISHNTFGQIFSVAASYTQLVLLNGIPEIYMNGGFNLDSTNVISLNKWHHIVAVINGPTGESWIYVDGAQDAYRSFGSVYITQSAFGSFNIGCEDYGDEQFHGKIDDMRFYNRALSASEVKQLYNQGAGTKMANAQTPQATGLNSGLLGHWTFDGKDMTQNVADTSGTSNTAVLTNFTSTTTEIGKIGQALRFNGSTNAVTIRDETKIFTSTGSFCTWVKSTNDNIGALFQDTASGQNDEFGIYIGDNTTGYLTNELIEVETNIIGSSINKIGYTTTNRNELFDNKWHHICVTAGGSYKIYLDGISKSLTVGNGADDGSFLDVSAYDRAYIGNDDTLLNAFNGSMDDARLYNRVLTASEVQQLYRMGR